VTAIAIFHGIGYQFRHRRQSRDDWYRALSDGLDDCHRSPVPREEVEAVHYGSCYRLAGGKGSDEEDDWDAEIGAVPPLRPEDVRPGLETDLIAMMAASLDENRPAEPAKAGVYLPRSVQQDLRRLDASPFLPRFSRRLAIWLVRQVHLYLTDDRIRACTQQRVERAVTARTRVLIGHSLGSVVAYEAACAHPEWTIDTLITLGSPLGIRSVGELVRPMITGGRGMRPPVRRWVNVAAGADPVALVKELKPIFGEVEDELVSNGRWRAHEIGMYLNAPPTAEAIADALG